MGVTLGLCELRPQNPPSLLRTRGARIGGPGEPNRVTFRIVNAPNLSRRLASRIVEGLKGRGRILVVKGGTAALVRAVDDAMSGYVEPIAERALRAPSLAEDPTTHEALSRLTGRVAQALLASEHLEDVFADRSVVEREVLDATRLALHEASASDEPLVPVELDLLGYVAATAGKRARPEALVQALERAGRVAGARLQTYDPASREAVFLPEPPTPPDLHLELEEAVADELSALVEQGAVALPTLERTVPLTREVSPAERARITRLVDRAATRTLRRTGNAAQWEITDGRNLRVVFTPLSEHDARDVNLYVASFADEVNALLAEAGAPLLAGPSTHGPAPEPTHHANGNGALLPAEEPSDEAAPSEPAPKSAARARAKTKRTPRSSTRTPASTRAAAAARTTTKKRAPAKRAATTTEEATRKKTKTTTKNAKPGPTRVTP